MLRAMSVGLLLFCAMPAMPALAFECANAGTATNPSDDTGQGGATACGNSATASGNTATAVGNFASAAGGFSIALGDLAQSDGISSTALGQLASSAGVASTALAAGASSSADFSIALGVNSQSAGSHSIALGNEAQSAGAFSTAVGYRATSPSPNTIVLGQIDGANFATGYTDVAIGTTAPLAPLHIFRADDTRELLFLESDETGIILDRPMMQLINNGGIRFQFDNEALGTQWRFQAATGNQDNFEVTKVGTGEIEFRVDASGNAFLTGMLSENSDRNAKQNIEAIDPEQILSRVAALPISEWEYKDTPGQRHVGPMAQDFRELFGLGANDTSLGSIDTSGVALASIQALAAQNRAVRSENRLLQQTVSDLWIRMAQLEMMESENVELRQRLALIEAVLKDLLPSTAGR